MKFNNWVINTGCLERGRVQELTEGLTEDNSMETTASTPEPDNKEENVEAAVPENKLAVIHLEEGF